MANRVYAYCMSKPYRWEKANRDDIRITVKKTALNFALDNGEDLDEVFDTVDAVTEMILNN